MCMEEKKLKKYRMKRDFSLTREPRGSIGKRDRKGLRFCVQHHRARSDHYDLRLEIGGVAASWAIPKGPSYNTKDKRLAMHVEDHPLDYMLFEGSIPKGEYGGGTVMLWDEGEWLPKTDPERGLEDGSLKFTLLGERLKGDWALVRMKGERERGEPWLLIKEKDAFARPYAGIGKFSRSLHSGRTFAEIGSAYRSNPFSQAEVMLAQLSESLPSDMGWVYELKYDGDRVLAFVEGEEARLLSRRGSDLTKIYSPAARAIEKLLGGRAAVLDGEMIVAGKDGLADFGALRRYARSGRGEGLVYVLFDLLSLDGEDLRSLPLLQRKEMLEGLLKGVPEGLKYSAHTKRLTKRELEVLKEKGAEGIVAKRADAPYTAGKCGDWLKIKFRKSREFVVGGYSVTSAGTLKALLVGYFEGKKLIYAGRVGTGFSEEDRRELTEALHKTEQGEMPFVEVPKGAAREAVWVKPLLAVQVNFAEMTDAGLLRQASYIGIRADKKAREIGAEKPIKQKIKRDTSDMVGANLVTHPEKVLFPQEKITKGELAEYYAAAASRMLPYALKRPLSVVCCPNGIAGESFFRRHLEGDFKGIGKFGSGEEEYFYLKDANGILSLAQYNAVEFHVWGVKIASPEKPDVMVFDLDPDEGLSLAAVRRGARDVKEILDALGLKSFLKTSGGKGYHIVVPFQRGTDGEGFSAFAKEVALLLENAYPTRYTATMSKTARVGKIFIDWRRNTVGSTFVAPYSVRARAGAPVSVPIAWEELSRISPASFTLKNIFRRLAAPDPWEEFFRVKSSQRLTKRSFTRMPE